MVIEVCLDDVLVNLLSFHEKGKRISCLPNNVVEIWKVWQMHIFNTHETCSFLLRVKFALYICCNPPEA